MTQKPNPFLNDFTPLLGPSKQRCDINVGGVQRLMNERAVIKTEKDM